jgi:uncharacterized membrane protein
MIFIIIIRHQTVKSLWYDYGKIFNNEIKGVRCLFHASFQASTRNFPLKIRILFRMMETFWCFLLLYKIFFFVMTIQGRVTWNFSWFILNICPSIPPLHKIKSYRYQILKFVQTTERGCWYAYRRVPEQFNS